VYKKLPNGEYIYLLLYVNDMPIASKRRSAINKLKNDLSSEFKIKDLGEAKKMLGMEIKRDWKSGVSLTQKGDLKKELQKFNINDDTKSVSTQLSLHFKLKATMFPTSIKEHEYMTHVPYASVIGSLIYAMVYIRPDLSQAFSMVNRHMYDPGRDYCETVK